MQMSSVFKKKTEEWLLNEISGWDYEMASAEAKLGELANAYEMIAAAEDSPRTPKAREVMAFTVADWCVREMIRDLYENKPVGRRSLEKQPLFEALDVLTSTQRQVLVQELYEHLWFTRAVTDRGSLMWQTINEHAQTYLE